MKTIIEHKSAEPSTHPANSDLTVADAAWVGTALLHLETKSDGPFSTEDIVNLIVSRNLTNGAYKSVWQHVTQHCVANRKPQPNRVCMLFATGSGNRRLYRDGDRRDPERMGGREHPDWDKLPSNYAYLRHWYETIWNAKQSTPLNDPLLDLAGTGRDMWNGQTADAYVATLREGWERSV